MIPEDILPDKPSHKMKDKILKGFYGGSRAEGANPPYYFNPVLGQQA